MKKYAFYVISVLGMRKYAFYVIYILGVLTYAFLCHISLGVLGIVLKIKIPPGFCTYSGDGAAIKIER